MKFTAAQSNALEYDKNMLVEAGAGSGKTAVFVERYVKICLENMTIEPENILALTFTNKAADECKERIRKRLEEEGSTQKNWSELLQKASITTFHGFCAQLCRQYSLILQLSPDFSILDENEANYLFQLAFEETIRDCSKAHDTHLKTYLKIFNLQRLEQDLLTCLKKKKWFLAAMNKNGSVNADEGVLLNALQHIFKKVGAKYQQLKVTLNCCDYDDLFVYVDELLRHPKVSQQLQRKYQYIMVDECQDTDPYQWELIQRLAADYHPLNEKKYFLVGDGKQSIYSFRGADLTLFNQLMETFEQNIDTSTIVRLADNFRSQSIILDTLNPLFETLFEKVGSQPMKYQPLNAFRTDVSGAVECHLIKDDATFQGEVNAISGWINNVCKLSQYSLNDIVILVRKRSQCQKWKEALQKHGIEVHLDQESGFFQKQPVIDLFQLCTISVVPNDALAWLTLLKSPFFSWNQDLIHGLFVCTNAGRIEDKWQEIEQWEDKLFKQFELNIDDQRLIKKACKWVKLFQKWRHTKSLSQLCIDFLTESGARKIYDEQNPFNHELIDQFLTIIENLEAQPYLSRYELIKRLEFRLKNTSTQIKALAGNREALRIMTIHASKGLEFPVVILPECNQPFPIKKSDPLMITANQVSLSLGSNITQPLRKEMLDQVKTLVLCGGNSGKRSVAFFCCHQ